MCKCDVCGAKLCKREIEILEEQSTIEPCLCSIVHRIYGLEQELKNFEFIKERLENLSVVRVWHDLVIENRKLKEAIKPKKRQVYFYGKTKEGKRRRIVFTAR